MYQNLVRSIDPQAPESVHLADWPVYDTQKIFETLNADMQLVMRLASLGHAARNQAAIKVRQPLARISYSVSNPDEVRALEQYADLLKDELNVKEICTLGSTGEAVSYSLKPLPKQLGQKYKALFPQVSKAILALDAEQAARRLLEGSPVEITVDGQVLQ